MPNITVKNYIAGLIVGIWLSFFCFNKATNYGYFAKDITFDQFKNMIELQYPKIKYVLYKYKGKAWFVTATNHLISVRKTEAKKTLDLAKSNNIKIEKPDVNFKDLYRKSIFWRIMFAILSVFSLLWAISRFWEIKRD